MKNPKIYLDTSVISYLDQQDSPEKMEETRLFWDMLKTGLYEVLISDLAFSEILQCELPKRRVLLTFLEEIEYMEVKETSETYKLAGKYIHSAVLAEKCFWDCRHIALASILQSGYIVSWNFRHMANVRTMEKVGEVNIDLGLQPILILPPNEFLYER